MTPKPRNVAASVRARLLAAAKDRGVDFQFVLTRYAAERFLYRLGKSAHRERFVLKGAMLLALWGGSAYRPTRDLDFGGLGSSEADTVLERVREICAVDVEDDGLVFDSAVLRAEPIREDAEYDGLRIRFQVTLGEARIPIQIDVGFGDAIEPPAVEVEYPTFFDGPAARVRAYPQEAVIAEKLHVLVRFGERTTRLKDIYDLYILAKGFAFDGARLGRSIAATFERRRTLVEGTPAALAPRFFSDETRAAQWRAYLDRNGLPGSPGLVAVGELLRGFLGPVWTALAARDSLQSAWKPAGPWKAIPAP